MDRRKRMFIIVLNFFEPVYRFKKQPETDQCGKEEDYR